MKLLRLIILVDFNDDNGIDFNDIELNIEYKIEFRVVKLKDV